ncbi:HK97-gp10 family putative phage morphogenesis protein [Streptomyces meridianus]|uniref:HK97 gp10 family phage protein n=1 Tax=Streptomyces meridianus TaxID=2938945 RepID=A0ABT0XD42_9ACTN|nr:HK97-gp10 family putative phage morphogenesis protein [Streptomyces meridianus]MCM2580447.1 hypothetical protein [Streptomyces meridianus]
MARARIDGLAGALRAVARVPRAMREARTETLHEWADNVQGSARGLVPQRTGDLHTSLDQKVEADHAEVGVWKTEQLEYAEYVEQGTSSMAEQPYLLPAFNEHRRQVPRTYRAAVRRHLGGGE